MVSRWFHTCTTCFMVVLVCFALPLSHASTRVSTAVAANPHKEASVRAFNRDVVTLRSELLGVSAEDRARRASARIMELLERGGSLTVSIKTDPAGQLIQIDGQTAFMLTPADINPVTEETLLQASERASRAIETIIGEHRESQDLKQMATSALVAAGFTLMAWLKPPRKPDPGGSREFQPTESLREEIQIQ